MSTIDRDEIRMSSTSAATGAAGEAVPPFANYHPYRIAGDLLFISGQVAFSGGTFPHRGRVGGELSLDEGRAAARICALNALAHAEVALGSLDRVASIARMTVYVSSAADFTQQHLVADGASDAMLERLGARGEHSRSAVASPRLPMDSPVEVEVTIQFR